MKKILVSLPDGVVTILDKDVIGKIGEGYSDTLRTIIMNWKKIRCEAWGVGTGWRSKGFPED